MKLTGPTRGALSLLRAVVVSTLGTSGCTAPEPVLSFIDDESNVSFTHPPRWSVGFAEQGGIRYRYVTAPKADGDVEALSVTMIAPAAAESVDRVAAAYLSGARDINETPGGAATREWTFKDSSGVASRLRLGPADAGRFFGAWVRGSEAAMKRYSPRVDSLLGSLRVEDPTQWPEERFAGMVARAPATWTRGSRLSSPTLATMQFKSLPLAVEKGTATVHGFVTLSKEPVPPPGDLEAFNRAVKTRSSDTVAVMEHRPWLALSGIDRAEGYVDYMRSGNTMTATRIRRWITVKNGVGLMLSCEARVDVFDRLDPWCRRMAYTVRLD